MKLKNYWLHFKTIIKHKWYVFLACKDCGIIWRGIKHDLSKFSLKEFVSSAKYFQGNNSPIDAEKIAKGYSIAWQHHKGHNTHHWQYWIDYIGVNPVELKMPYWDVVELICDWIGAGKAYNQIKWTQNTPWEYWLNNKNNMRFHTDTYKFIDKVLLCIKNRGWKLTANILKRRYIKY